MIEPWYRKHPAPRAVVDEAARRGWSARPGAMRDVKLSRTTALQPAMTLVIHDDAGQPRGMVLFVNYRVVQHSLPTRELRLGYPDADTERNLAHALEIIRHLRTE